MDPVFSAFASLPDLISSQEIAPVYYSYLYEHALVTFPTRSLASTVFSTFCSSDLKMLQSKGLPYFELYMVP